MSFFCLALILVKKKEKIGKKRQGSRLIGNEVFISCYEYDMNSYIFANKSLILILIGGYIFEH